MRRFLSIAFLLKIKILTRIFYRHELVWLSEPPKTWDYVPVVAVLNHTSLYEWLYVGTIPNRLVIRIATHGLVPAAKHTIERPFFGRFIKLMAPHFISITREPDDTWEQVLAAIDDVDPMVIIFPEGRMKRANGLDKHGEPMTVRGGIADILHAFDEGRMLVAYSSGLHHVQVPGQRLPKLFRKIRMKLELIDIAEYKQALMPSDGSHREFKRRVKSDLESRRDLHCPIGAERLE